MTLAELQAYVGAPPSRGAVYFTQRDGGLRVMAWADSIGAEPGWWYAITREVAGREVVAAMGWSAGNRRDRDIEIATSLVRVIAPAPPAEELPL